MNGYEVMAKTYRKLLFSTLNDASLFTLKGTICA